MKPIESGLGYKQDLGMLGNRKIAQVGSRNSLINMCYLLLIQYLNLHAKNNVLTPYIFAIKTSRFKVSANYVFSSQHLEKSFLSFNTVAAQPCLSTTDSTKAPPKWREYLNLSKSNA